MVKSGKSTLLVEEADEAQVRRLENIKLIAEEAVIVELHKILHHIKGVVKSKALDQSTREELRERLADQGVTHSQRITIKKNN